MISKNKADAVFYTLLVCCSLVLTPASLADLRTPVIDPTCHVMDKIVDDDVYITCHVKSNPTAKITWFFNEKPLNLVDRSQRHKQDATSCSQKLYIPYARIKDSGAYTCVASNQYGTVNHTCELTVSVPGRSFHIINNGIRLHGVSASDKAAIGSPLNMSCEVYNVHFVYWTKNGIRFPPKVPPNSENPRISTSRKRKGATAFVQYLVFTHVLEEDGGNYSCAGRDMILSETIHSYKYLETVPDRSFHIINNGIRLHGVSASDKAAIGSPLNMSCEVYNVHFVYWTKNGIRFPPKAPPNSENPRISTSRKRKGATAFVQYLVFTHVLEEDGGNYSCAGRDMILSETIHSYKYLETVSTPVSAERKSSLSSRKSVVPRWAYLFILGFSLRLDYPIMI